MQDDKSNITTAPSEPEAYASSSAAPAVRRKSGFGATFMALVMFLAGGGLVGYLAWQGELDRYLPARPNALTFDTPNGNAASTTRVAPQATPPTSAQLATIIPLETRLAMLEDRFSRLDFKADTAAGNAARAESLLIALAARRRIERGDPLDYVSDQLKLRFADAQPKAVNTIITFSANPVTIDQLAARLEALAPNLTDRSQQVSFVQRARRAMLGLFVVHSDSPTLFAPSARLDRARLMLTSRRITNAIDEVERLPGASSAHKWIADARRFEDVQSALDLIETTAMIEPRRLRDGSGQYVSQPSPISSPQPSPQSQVDDQRTPNLIPPQGAPTTNAATEPPPRGPTPAPSNAAPLTPFLP